MQADAPGLLTLLLAAIAWTSDQALAFPHSSALLPSSHRPNSPATTMSSPGVGFEYPYQPVAWLKRDALLFANSIGCKADELHFLYVRRGPASSSPPSLPRLEVPDWGQLGC